MGGHLSLNSWDLSLCRDEEGAAISAELARVPLAEAGSLTSIDPEALRVLAPDSAKLSRCTTDGRVENRAKDRNRTLLGGYPAQLRTLADHARPTSRRRAPRQGGHR